MMNTYANGTSALQFPSHYVPLTEEEMTYVNGGYTVTKNWHSITLKLTGKETAQFLSDASWAAGIVVAATGLGGGVAAAVVGSILCGSGLVISRMNKNNSGVSFVWGAANVLNYSISHRFSSLLVPRIKENY